jgi:hypothetical protein
VGKERFAENGKRLSGNYCEGGRGALLGLLPQGGNETTSHRNVARLVPMMAFTDVADEPRYPCVLHHSDIKGVDDLLRDYRFCEDKESS